MSLIHILIILVVSILNLILVVCLFFSFRQIREQIRKAKHLKKMSSQKGGKTVKKKQYYH